MTRTDTASAGGGIAIALCLIVAALGPRSSLAAAGAPTDVKVGGNEGGLVRPVARTPSSNYEGFAPVCNGIRSAAWRMSTISRLTRGHTAGRFTAVDDIIETVPGTDMGLRWCSVPTPPDFELKLEWRRTAAHDNSGILVRFPNIQTHGYNNSADAAFAFGFEIQIDDYGSPDGALIHRTGAIYGQPGQVITWHPSRPVGEWNEFLIRVKGQTYTVYLNGRRITVFHNHDPRKGRPSTRSVATYVGLQVESGRVDFRNLAIRAL